MIRLTFRFLIILCALFAGCSRDEKPIIFTPIDLNEFSSNLKGFNLLGKVDINWSNNGFNEDDFEIIRDLGFNFARIPLDYRTYTLTGDWDTFLGDEIAEIDKVVEWGKKYGIHICLCLHRAPGYCVNPSDVPANQDLDLWTDVKAQDAFVNHWAYFAERYRDSHYSELSFNLLNEPANIDEASCANVMLKAVNRIRNINPDRVIFIDGLNFSRELMLSLQGERNIIQVIHVYDPHRLTHYKADWVAGSDSWPLPSWPMTDISQYLYGPWQNEYHSSLVLEGSFEKDAEITVNVNQVSVRSTLQIKLDDTPILSKEFVCGSEPGEDWTEIILTQWGYQNISGKDYSVVLPAAGAGLAFTNTDGDWLSINKISIKSGTEEVVIIPANTEWGSKQDIYTITSGGNIVDKDGKPMSALNGLTATLESASAQKIPLMVQEFGVYNQTPHDVTISYLTDVVSALNGFNIGFAMWNMTGTFGIFNSGRADCPYESYRGLQLDRELLTILQGNRR